MTGKLKFILLVIGIVFTCAALTAYADPRDQQQGQQRGSAVHNNPESSHHSQGSAPVQARQEPSQQKTFRIPVEKHAWSQPVQQKMPEPVQHEKSETAHHQWPEPHVNAVIPSGPVENNDFFHHHHREGWRPRYNFYDNEYHFYPYVNVASGVELSANYVTVLFDGQTYFFDRGSFYIQTPQGFLAVPPPLGIIVGAISPHARKVDMGGQIYYRHKGICFIQVEQGYQVVEQVQAPEDGS